MTAPITLSSLDQHFADTMVRIDRAPCDALWLAAALASHAARQGHTCLDFRGCSGRTVVPASDVDRPLAPPEPAAWSERLAGCDTVGAPGEYAPLVLCGPRLYLHKAWKHEHRVAEGLLARSAALDVDPGRLDALLDRYFPAGTAVQQREAARCALTRRLAVISGGPGTGKTSTVARVLAILLELSGEEPPTVALAAPTGKAAMRLRHSVRLAAERLELPPGVRERLPRDVTTIHRLLGMRGDGRTVRHHRGNRLPCGLLVVDEASMVDLTLMARLLEALRDDARLIFLGDRDQLASVEAGAVLADICAGGEAGGPVAVAQLTTSYRFGQESGIGALSRLVNAGDGAGALALLRSGEYGDIAWRPLPAGREFAAAFRAAAAEGFATYLGAETPVAALAALERFRVLAAHREGPHGVATLNRLCEAALGLSPPRDGGEYRRMPLMVSGNNYELGLFNGDTAVLLDEEGGRLAAWFDDGAGGVRRLSPLRLPPHETAFALTVHKSQGSEYDRVLLILPEQLSEVLTRELLYTGITRARQRVEIWGNEEVFLRAVERRTERNSGLRERLCG